MAIAPTGGPDLAAIKQRQQATWASGDYHMIGTQILLVSEQLIESLDVHSTDRVLDVATGSGNAALAAARRGCDGRRHRLRAGPARSGATARRRRRRRGGVRGRRCRGAPLRGRQLRRRHARSSARCSRRPGADRKRTCPGHPARAAGSGSSRIRPRASSATCSRSIGTHVPPPAGLRSPIQWGTEDRLRELFGDAIAEPQRREAAHDVSATARRRPTSITGGGSTVRRSRRSKPSARRGAPPSRPICSSTSRASTGPTTARWSCRANISRPSSSRADPTSPRSRELKLAAPNAHPVERQGDRAIHAARSVSFRSRAL